MKNDSIFVQLRTARDIIKGMTKPKSNEEYTITSEILAACALTSNQGHARKGLCLTDKCFNYLMRYMEKTKHKNIGFLQDFDINLPLSYKEDLLKKLGHGSISRFGVRQDKQE